MIERVWIYTWRPWSSELTDALWGRDRMSLMTHLGGIDCSNLEAGIKQVWLYTWGLESSEPRDALWSCNWARLEMYFEAMIKRGWWRTWQQSTAAVLSADENLFISYLTHNRGSMMRWLDICTIMDSWLKAVDLVGRHTRSCSYIQESSGNHENDGNTANLGCMLYLVYAGVLVYAAVLGVCCCTWCTLLYLEYIPVLSVCCTRC